MIFGASSFVCDMFITFSFYIVYVCVLRNEIYSHSGFSIKIGEVIWAGNKRE